MSWTTRVLMNEQHTTEPVISPDVADTIRGQNEDTKSISQIRRAIADMSGDDVDTPPPTTVTPPAVGDLVGEFVLQEKLGAGVSCFVFRGADQRTNRQVAMKIINWANVFDRTAAMRQMRTEAAALSRVKHPRVVQFIDFGFDPRWPYLVTEFVEGQPLGNLLRSGGSLPLDWCVFIASQVAEALGAVWKGGLVHRDIKPDNVLVGSDGAVKLIDFGLAKQPVLQAMSESTGPELAGTASYLAPEQAKDASIVDLRADIYSLGVTFYEMLTGKLPFEGRNRIQMIFHHLNTNPVPPNQVNTKVPSLVSDLCMWMLAKNPNERPQNAEELRDAFDAVGQT
jgi:serine/threonine protein kinase